MMTTTAATVAALRHSTEPDRPARAPLHRADIAPAEFVKLVGDFVN